MRQRRSIALIGAAAAVAVATGVTVWLVARDDTSTPAKPAADPIAFLRTVVQDIAANRYGHAWLTLHPAQQRVATKQAYVKCERQSPIPGHLVSITVLKVYDEAVRVPGSTTDPVTTTAVTFLLKIADFGGGSSVAVQDTVHAVAVDGHWTWILPAKRLNLYTDRTCV